MPRDYNLYLDDMVNAVTAIPGYVDGYDYDQFVTDQRTVDAILHNLTIIGEAAAKLPASEQEKLPQIEWRKIIGLRNIVVHEYFGISYPIIWDVVTNKLDSLADACKKLLEE